MSDRGFSPVQPVMPKLVTEYRLPAATQTHEVVAINEELLLISQQSCSMLVKVKLKCGIPQAATRHLVGKSHSSGLHGLFASVKYPGNVWVTIQFDNAIERLDCVSQDLDSPPECKQHIDFSGTEIWGPHVVIEVGDDLWITFKGSNHIARVNHTRQRELSIYQCSSRPVFVAVHPTSGDAYASLHLSSKIFRLVRKPEEAMVVGNNFPHIGNTFTETTSEIDIPPEKGTLPVGLVAGPDGNVWFVMLGGRGSFGRISKEGVITWFNLTSPVGATAGLIHLAFERRPHSNDTPLCCYLLSSSAGSMTTPDAVIRVYIYGNPSKVGSEIAILLPTPGCMTHRILPHGTGLFVTEMMTSMFAHIQGSALTSRTSETADDYSLWGWGASLDSVSYY